MPSGNGKTISEMGTTILGPDALPKPKVNVAGVLPTLQGTTTPYSSLLTAPTPAITAFAIASGRYVKVVPLSRTTGAARPLCEYCVLLLLPCTEKLSSVTVKLVIALD